MPLSRRMPGPAGISSSEMRAGTGKIIVVRILGVDAALDGVAAQRDVLLRERQRLAGGDADLQVHQVESGDQFGDRMLDLQARIHLEEIEIALLIHQELDRAGVGVAGGLRDPDGDLAHLAAAFRA